MLAKDRSKGQLVVVRIVIIHQTQVLHRVLKVVKREICRCPEPLAIVEARAENRVGEVGCLARVRRGKVRLH